MEQLLIEKYKEDLNYVNDVEELILDALTTLPVLSANDKTFLERFRTLTYLSMNNLGLTSVANFPEISTLMLV